MTTRRGAAQETEGSPGSVRGAKPAVLDADSSALLRLSTSLLQLISRDLRDLWRRNNLSERSLFIIEMVNAGLDRPGRLIEYFDVLASTITFETDKLAAAGILQREPDPDDRRIVRLKLTDKGRAVHRELTEILNASLRPRLDHLTAEELRTLLGLFAKVVGPLEPPYDQLGAPATAAGED